MEIQQLLYSRRHCPANIPQLNCQLNYSAISSQSPLQNSTLNGLGQSQNQSYITTDGQLASLSWNKALIWSLRTDLITVRQFRVCWCGALSLTRGRVCRLQLLLALARAVPLGSESCGTRDHILLSQIRDLPLRRLLRLAGLRWRYLTPPPHGVAPVDFLITSLHGPNR
jgi:hypothetical protein